VKKFLIILGVILSVLLLGGGWLYYDFTAPDPVIEQELQEELPEGFFEVSELEKELNEFEETDSNGTEESSTPEEDTQNQNNNTHTSKNNKTQTNTSNESNSKHDPAKKEAAPAKKTTEQSITVESIDAKYAPRFQKLESIALNRLETLKDNAIAEYNRKKKEGTLDKGALAKKYLQAANKLEGAIETTFERLLSQMEHDLKVNNLPTDLVKKAKKEYQESMDEKKSEIYSKLSGKL